MVTAKELEKKYRASEARQHREIKKLTKERNAATDRWNKKQKEILDKESEYRLKLFKQMEKLKRSKKRRKK